MKNRVYLIICCISFIYTLQSQDSMWYVLNYKGRSFGSAIPSGQYPYDNTLASNTFTIRGISAPVFTAPDGTLYSNVPRNDLFIIYNDGSFYSSRDQSPAISFNSSENFKSFSIPVGKKPQYLYFSNIYEKDDPPQNISVDNNLPKSSTIENITYSTTNTLKTNHDIVRGKDITLVIPDSLFNSCPFVNLKISQATDGANNFGYILKLRDVFDHSGNLNWSYHSISPDIVQSGSYIMEIKKIPPPTPPSKFHYFNFNSDFENNLNLIGKQVVFTATCSTTNTIIQPFISETISDLHDPNYIEVKCIYKKKCFSLFGMPKYKYFAKYYVQFMNDGDQEVDWVKVNFKLPPITKPNTCTIGIWYYGGTSGCSNNPPGGEVNFTELAPSNYNFDITLGALNGSKLKKQDQSDMNKIANEQYGRFEFCVELKIDPTSYNFFNLEPESPTTQFEDVTYPIFHFKDPYFTDKVQGEGNLVKFVRNRKITTNAQTCNCNCP